MRKTKKKNGFTYIETLIYIALATIVLGLIFSYGWNVLSIRERSTTISETTSDAQFLSERIGREIRAALSVNKDQSVFDENPGKLVLKTADGEVIIESSNDKISIQRNGDSADYLHRDTVRVKNFIFTKEEAADNKIIYVGFSFDAQAYFPGAGNRFEYLYSIPVRSGVEVRSQ